MAYWWSINSLSLGKVGFVTNLEKFRRETLCALKSSSEGTAAEWFRNLARLARNTFPSPTRRLVAWAKGAAEGGRTVARPVPGRCRRQEPACSHRLPGGRARLTGTLNWKQTQQLLEKGNANKWLETQKDFTRKGLKSAWCWEKLISNKFYIPNC